MDSFELNKIIGAVLATVFVVFSVGIISDSIFAAHAPEQPGYAIEAAEPEAAGPEEGGVEAGPEPIAPLLASADPAAGEAIFKRCAACHTAEQGGVNKIGPNLWNIVNRPVASHEGFSYSAGMKAFAESGTVWDYEHLSSFILSPKELVKGTAMNFPGLKKPEDRANLIAYLRTLSDSPAPLPEATAEAPAEEGAAAPAEGAAPAAEGEAPAAEGATPAAEDQTPATEEAAPAESEAPAEGQAPAETPAANEPAAETEAAPADQPATDAPAEEEQQPNQ